MGGINERLTVMKVSDFFPDTSTRPDEPSHLFRYIHIHGCGFRQGCNANDNCHNHRVTPRLCLSLSPTESKDCANTSISLKEKHINTDFKDRSHIFCTPRNYLCISVLIYELMNKSFDVNLFLSLLLLLTVS